MQSSFYTLWREGANKPCFWTGKEARACAVALRVATRDQKSVEVCEGHHKVVRRFYPPKNAK